MASTNADPQVGTRRWRWIRLGVWVLALLWFAHYAYVRVTTPPAAALATPTRTDVTGWHDELLELIDELPVAPPPTEAPWFGWWPAWGSSAPAAALAGEWEPGTNRSQDDARKFINKPTTTDVLDRIVVLCAQREESADASDPSLPARFDPQSGQFNLPRYQDAIAALTFRARYRAVEKADPAGALTDLRAAARIAMAQQRSRSSGMWWMEQGALLIQYELGCLVREANLSPDLAGEMITFLTDELSLSVANTLRARVSADTDVDRLLDRYYTDDGHGNGWLVLSAASEQLTLFYASPATDRSRVWNIFSPLFSDRRTVRAKLLGLTDDFRQLDQMTYEEAQHLFANRSQSGRGGSVLDGPLLELTQGVDEYTFQQSFEQVARRRALVVMLALSAHKHARGVYPETLDALTPDCLTEVPLDALTGRPFRYERLAEGDYDLGPGVTEEETTALFDNWWTPPEAYRPNSHVPQRTPGSSPNQP